MRLFKVLFLLMLVASLVPTLMVGWLSVSDARELLVRDAQELAQERVKQLHLKVEGYLGEPQRAVLSLARVPGFFALPLSEQRTHLASVLNQAHAVLAVTVFDKDRQRLPGLQAFAVNDLPPTAVAEHEVRARALLEGLTTGVRHAPAEHGGPNGVPVLTLAFALGEPARGYVAADISLSGLTPLLAQERVGSSGFVYLVDARGRLVAGGSALGGAQDVSSRPPVAHLREWLVRLPGSQLHHVGNFGSGEEAVVAAYSVLPELAWAVVSEQPVALAYKQVDTMRRRLALGVVAALLVALTLAAVFSRTLTRPLKEFTARALELARGQFGVEVALRPRNELGELAQTFNYMSKQLLAYDGENRRLYESLELGYLETMRALANSLDSKDPYTRGHSQRVADLAVDIGREMKLTERQLKHLQFGGILHDIGKIGIVDSILSKQTSLTPTEMVTMREHPSIGDTIIEPISFLSGVRACVRNHHERWDGTGYPDALKGEAIPVLARIVACADTFDACTSTRPYQKAMSLPEAMAIIDRLTGTQLDPSVAAALHRVVDRRLAQAAAQEEAQEQEPVKAAS